MPIASGTSSAWDLATVSQVSLKICLAAMASSITCSVAKAWESLFADIDGFHIFVLSGAKFLFNTINDEGKAL